MFSKYYLKQESKAKTGYTLYNFFKGVNRSEIQYLIIELQGVLIVLAKKIEIEKKCFRKYGISPVSGKYIFSR